ncbi:MAG: tyrosine-type recombinase/integrase, partial [Tomitella sp.]|nr:tyrosine-type recombinase/integrase [Tomitella sp.]
RGYLYRLVDHVYRQAGMPAMTRGKGVAVHALRHTYATLLHETGASVLEIQRLLGHTSPATSARYVTVSTAGLHGLTEGITAGLE